mgnify:CR=1 FL=1
MAVLLRRSVTGGRRRLARARVRGLRGQSAELSAARSLTNATTGPSRRRGKLPPAAPVAAPPGRRQGRLELERIGRAHRRSHDRRDDRQPIRRLARREREHPRGCRRGRGDRRSGPPEPDVRSAHAARGPSDYLRAHYGVPRGPQLLVSASTPIAHCAPLTAASPRFESARGALERGAERRVTEPELQREQPIRRDALAVDEQLRELAEARSAKSSRDAHRATAAAAGVRARSSP